MSKTEWIRCEDRLPEDQERILFTTDYFVAGHKITVAGRFDSKGNRFIPIEEAPQDEYLTCEIECWTPYPDSSKCKSGWIKCEDRLPDVSGRYLTYDGFINCFDYSAIHKRWNCMDWMTQKQAKMLEIDSVKYWMPIPELEVEE